MKQFLTILFAMLTSSVCVFAQGWPANYGGVMLQGFYWDSYDDTQWTKLELQANELSQYFNLIWVPNSAYAGSLTKNMGYHPVYWYDHKSAFGTEAALRKMIQTFKTKGTGFIEDVVINHRNGASDWTDFPTEKVNGVSWQLTPVDICSDDEAAQNGKIVGPNKDTGKGWSGARDLDHTGTNVQKNVINYLKYLHENLGYIGYRYDFVKGYAPQYTGLYNHTVGAAYSVGEYWDGDAAKVKNWINGTKYDNVIQSAAFDFPMKYAINDALGNGKWNRLAESSLTNDAAYSRYSVTFVDNHDTGRSSESGGAPLYANVTAANAYILAMPGTPCVFLSHWKAHKTIIKKLITARKVVGLNNQSTILNAMAQADGFILNVQGTIGKTLLLLGTTTGIDLAGYKLAVEGENFKYYVSENVNISTINDIQEDTPPFTAPDFCKVNEGETCAFFEAPSNWTNTVFCWRWDKTHNYTGGKWPGTACTKVGTTTEGKAVWKWTWDEASINSVASNEGIIFSNNGNPQTTNLAFVNGGYYSLDGWKGTVKGTTTGISRTIGTDDKRKAMKVYTIDGRLVRHDANPVAPLQDLDKGIYVVGKKKYVVK